MTQVDTSATNIAPENTMDAMANILTQAGFGVENAAPPAAPRIETFQEQPAPTTEPVAPVEPVIEPSTTEPQVVEVLHLPDGRILTLEDAERFAEFEARVMQDPRFLRAYQQAFGESETEPVPPSAPQAPAPATEPTTFQLPQELADELADNPLARTLYQQIQRQGENYDALVSQLGEVKGLTTKQQEFLDNYQRQNAATLVNQAQANFQRERSLTTTDMDKVRNTAINMFDFDRLVSLPVNPITGQMEAPDPVRRMELAFDAAYRAIPEFFDREQNTRIEAARVDAERKAKLTSLSSSGSSAPPAAPVDNSDPGARRAALVADIAAAQSGNYIQPE